MMACPLTHIKKKSHALGKESLQVVDEPQMKE
jgi:hypothetical protein